MRKFLLCLTILFSSFYSPCGSKIHYKSYVTNSFNLAEYHFIYIDISKTAHLTELQAKLDTLFSSIKHQKFIFFLSNLSNPIIADDSTQFENIQLSISNLTPPIPYIESDIIKINTLFNKDDFVVLNQQKIEHRYKSIVWHFFLDPRQYQNMALGKSLIQKLLLVNGNTEYSSMVKVNLYFNIKDFNSFYKDQKGTFANEKHIELIKY